MFWGILIFWLIKYELIWEPLQFFMYFIPIIGLFFVPSYFFLRSIVELVKNLKLEKNFLFSKRYLYISAIFFLAISSFTSWASIVYFVSSGSLLYNYDDGPYLIWNDNPETSTTIIWITKEPSVTELKYGKSLYGMESYKKTIPEKRHMAELKNLTPGTIYYYQILEFSSRIYTFKTAPGGTSFFNFIALSDTQNSGGLTTSSYGLVIDAIAHYKYDFIVHAGDVLGSNGNDLDSWHVFFNFMERQATNHPYMISLGNHEYDEDFFGRNFKYFFPYDYAEDWGHYYSFNYSNVHFCMIDVFQNQLDWGGFVSETQESWIRRDLAANQDKWLIVVLHAPLYSTGHFNMNQQLIYQLAPIFYEYEVDIVLSGHDHDYEAFWTNRTEKWGGTYYFVTGGGGGSLDDSILNRENNPWKHEWHNASIQPYQKDYITVNDQLYGEISYHFMYFEVRGKNLRIQVIRPDLTQIQEFRIKK